jgi:hypothetical protein
MPSTTNSREKRSWTPRKRWQRFDVGTGQTT